MFVEFETIKLLLPEMILTALAAWIYVGGTFTRSRAWWTAFALASYVVAGVALFQQDQTLWERFNEAAPLRASGPLAIDFLGHSVRWLALLVGVLFTLMASRAPREDLAAEFLGTLMLVSVGMMLVAAANDLVLLFLGLEMVSIPTYILLFLSRRDRAAGEATAKYFFLGVFSSAILLYGLSFLYGIGGGTTLAQGAGIGERIALLAAGGGEGGHLALLPAALLLIFAGLGFKIAAVPFHFYAPDVYQGTSSVGAGLLAVAPKIAGLLALVRLVAIAMPAAAQFAWQLAIVLSIITMTLGNVCALWQSNVRRLLAYSSVAHAGYLLIGLAVALATSQVEGQSGLPGLAAMLFYLAAYVLASTGAFATLAYFATAEREVDHIDELSGLGKTQPWAGAVLALSMFSLAGIPPLVGFWGKFSLFTGAVGLATGEGGTISAWFGLLALVGALNAAVAAAYYLRIVGVLYFRPAPAEARAEPAGGWGALAAFTVCGVLMTAIGFAPGQLVGYAELAARSVQIRSVGQRASRAQVLETALGRRQEDPTAGAPLAAP